MFFRVYIPTLVLCAVSGYLAGQNPGPASLAGREVLVENCYAINSPNDDAAPTLYGDQLVFLTEPRRGTTNPRTGRPYLRLHVSRIGTGGLPDKETPFGTDFSGSFNDGVVCFALQDQVMYYSRPQGNSPGSGRPAPSGLYSMYNDGYDWTAERELPHNTPAFDNQHPTITPDGRRLFFSSNQPGGYGGYDLYFADSRAGRWGPAINLGPEINTEGDETFPRLHATGYLFFTSDGHRGLGGADVYAIDLGGRRWGALLHLPAPINSTYDDEAFLLDDSGSRGYLSSNRPGGSGKYDVYAVALKGGLEGLRRQVPAARGLTFFDAFSSKKIAGAAVWIAARSGSGRLPGIASGFTATTDGRNKIVRQTSLPTGVASGRPTGYTDARGNLAYTFDQDRSYLISVAAPGYGIRTLPYEPARDRVGELFGFPLHQTGCRQVSGRLTDAHGVGLPDVEISYRELDSDAGTIRDTTDLGGFYTVCLPSGAVYAVAATGRTLPVTKARLDLTEANGQAVLRQEIRLPYGEDIDHLDALFSEAVLTLREINYAYLSANPIRETSTDLDVLREFLRQYPPLKVLLTVHVDGPDPAARLQRLSEERALRLKRLLVEEGIAEDRIFTIGSGNAAPLVTCTDCSDSDYRANTRTEMKVVGW